MNKFPLLLFWHWCLSREKFNRQMASHVKYARLITLKTININKRINDFCQHLTAKRKNFGNTNRRQRKISMKTISMVLFSVKRYNTTQFLSGGTYVFNKTFFIYVRFFISAGVRISGRKTNTCQRQIPGFHSGWSKWKFCNVKRTLKRVPRRGAGVLSQRRYRPLN